MHKMQEKKLQVIFLFAFYSFFGKHAERDYIVNTCKHKHSKFFPPPVRLYIHHNNAVGVQNMFRTAFRALSIFFGMSSVVENRIF